MSNTHYIILGHRLDDDKLLFVEKRLDILISPNITTTKLLFLTGSGGRSLINFFFTGLIDPFSPVFAAILFIDSIESTSDVHATALPCCFSTVSTINF